MNLTNMIEADELLNKKDKINKVFFFRVCGTGMGACACLLKESGLDVEGADVSFSPPMSTYLDSTGIPCFSLSDVNHEFLQKYDLIVVGNSVPRNSDHAKLIEESGVAFTSFPSVMGTYVLKNKNVIGVAGTHGKTTTTFFMTQMLENMGVNPGYFIGGIMDGRPPAQIGSGAEKLFIIESDEYDSAYFQKYSKFRLYELNNMILTSLEFDHADIFSSVEDIEEEFEAVIPNLEGNIVANDAYPSILKLQSKFASRKWFIYGDTSELGPKIESLAATGSLFDLIIDNESCRFETDMVGEHNILNIASCLIMLSKLGFKKVELQQAVKSLSLVKRRQEYRGQYHNNIVIDDFAHHPKAIKLTIDAIKTRYPNKKIITIFEPISATARSSYFQKEFAESLLSSDKVIIAQNPLQTTVKNQENLDCEKLVSDISSTGIISSVVTNLDILKKRMDEYIQGDEGVLLILSNRTCLGLWESNFVDEIK